MSSHICIPVERCKDCSTEIFSSSCALISQMNNHWRDYNHESVSSSSCAFEPQLDIRVGATPLNPEDLEVSSHMNTTFHYAYSPQTEPSNLSLAHTRCSPLNLTGRTSPSSSALSAESVSTHSSIPTNVEAPHIVHMSQIENPVATSEFIPNGMYSLDLTGTGSDLQFSSTTAPNMADSLNMTAENIHMSHDNYLSLSKRKKTLDKRYQLHCFVCNHSFFTKTSYDEHMHSHLKEDNQYFLHSNPNIIQPNVENNLACTNSKPFKCSICDTEFFFKEELVEHSSVHEISKPYRCDICGIGVSYIGALKRHKMLHSGLKPHQCDACKKSFIQKCDLRRHIAAHAKKVECKQCKRNFVSAAVYKNHKCKTIGDPKPYSCTLCGQGCSNDKAWSYHMWKHTKNPVFVPYQVNLGSPTS